MNKQDMMVKIAAIVSALDETGGSPESMLYIFCNMNIHEYNTIRDILVQGGLVTVKGNFVTLTAKGQDTAKELNKVLTARKS